MSTMQLLSVQDRQAAESKATRAALGETLVELVAEGRDIMAVDADLSGSTTTARFAEAYPERFSNVGIAEQNMIGVAAGLALTGSTVFTGSFAAFGTGRVYDQIRNTVCASNLDVKVTPTHAGISVGPDGGSHQMLEDLALMCAVPGMRVLAPSDYHSAKAALKLAADTPGPVYVRLSRAKFPQLYAAGGCFALGSSQVLREGDDITLLACGYEVHEALKAAAELERRGVDAEVIDLLSIKPLDEETIVRSASRTGRVVCAEEHVLDGGLGSRVAQVLARSCPVPMAFIGIDGRFGQSGEFGELLSAYQLDCGAIVEAAVSLL